jgi:hypothetical protein
MPNFEMWDFLSTAAADYPSTMLNVSPQRTLTEMGNKNQIIHLGDDGSEERITFNSTTVFKVSLQWDVLNEADSGTIFNFFHSTALANGLSRSFRWQHPTDGHKYTVRFDSQLDRSIAPASIYGVGQISLKILGRATG